MKQTIGYFGFQAAVYDAYQSSCVPKYAEMVSVATEFLHRVFHQHRNIAVLDLGCGTGNTTIKLMKLFTEARFSCLDGSREMIREAQKKIPRANVDFRLQDLAERNWSSEWGESVFDAVISVLVLEHLDFEAYRNCLAEVLRILKPGGRFITVEGYAGETTQQLYFREMAACEENAIASSAITREQLAEIKRRSAEEETHYYARMEDKKAWWLDAGFRDVTFIWQYYCVATLTGQKMLKKP